MTNEALVILIAVILVVSGVIMLSVARFRIKKEENKLRTAKEKEKAAEAEKQKKTVAEAKKKDASVDYVKALERRYKESMEEVLRKNEEAVNSYLEELRGKYSTEESQHAESRGVRHESKRDTSRQQKGYSLLSDSLYMEDDIFESDNPYEENRRKSIYSKNFYENGISSSPRYDADSADYFSAYHQKTLSSNLFGDKMKEKIDSPMAKEINELSSTMKAMLIGDILKKKD